MRAQVLRAFVGLLAAFLVIGGGSALAKPTPQTLIVPGSSIGPVKLNMSRAEVEKVLGKPDNVEKVAEDFVVLQWFERELVVSLDGEAGRVSMISTHSSQYETMGGGKVGLPLSALKALHPNGKKAEVEGLLVWSYDAQGINFANDAPTDDEGNPIEGYAAPTDWLITDVNVFSPIK